jgi:hypothetical protein
MLLNHQAELRMSEKGRGNEFSGVSHDLFVDASKLVKGLLEQFRPYFCDTDEPPRVVDATISWGVDESHRRSTSLVNLSISVVYYTTHSSYSRHNINSYWLLRLDS